MAAGISLRFPFGAKMIFCICSHGPYFFGSVGPSNATTSFFREAARYIRPLSFVSTRSEAFAKAGNSSIFVEPHKFKRRLW